MRWVWTAVLLGCFTPAAVEEEKKKEWPGEEAFSPFIVPEEGEPVFDGEAISAEVAPAPLSGGALLINRSATLAFAANSDASAIEVINLADRRTIWIAHVTPGSEPNRMVEDSSGKVHVVLRRSGEIATLDVQALSVVTKKTCPSPRGIAVDGSDVLVACEGGELMREPTNGAPSSQVNLGRDLRDVIVGTDGYLYVTRFRAASLLKLTKDGSLISERLPFEDELIAPHVAWRAVLGSDGAIFVLHQYASKVSLPTGLGGSVYYGGSNVSDVDASAGHSCGSRPVSAAITRFDGGEPTDSMVIGSGAPSVDLAFDGATKTLMVIGGGRNGGLAIVHPGNGYREPRCESSVRGTRIGKDLIGGAFRSGRVVLLTRAPGELVEVPYYYDKPPQTLATLSTPFNTDTGYDVFQTTTSVGISCASCHPEGGDDGHVWRFDIGKRRTQSIRGGISKTAPFHWDGKMPNYETLLHEVFSGRMGGGDLTKAQVDVLAKWIDRIPGLPSPSTVDPQLVEKGADLFTRAQCEGCHSGSLRTSNETIDVGTGGSFQVPSLRGIGGRAPYMHDGCAPTMHARLTDPKCAGSQHGKLGGLTETDITALEAFLESL